MKPARVVAGSLTRAAASTVSRGARATARRAASSSSSTAVAEAGSAFSHSAAGIGDAAAFDHVLLRMLPVSTPIFRIYPSALPDGVLPYGRMTDASYLPRIVLGLDHPSFPKRTVQGSFVARATGGRNCPVLAELRGVYSPRVRPGGKGVLCDLSQLQFHSVEIPKEGSTPPSSDTEIDVEMISAYTAAAPLGASRFTQTVPRSTILGGWPCITAEPWTAADQLARDIAFMWPVAGVAGHGAAPLVGFERNGAPIDGATTFRQLAIWAAEGERIDVTLDGARVPLRDEPRHARKGAPAAWAAWAKAREPRRAAFSGAFGLIMLGNVLCFCIWATGATEDDSKAKEQRG